MPPFIRRRELRFLIDDVLNLGALFEAPCYSQHDQSLAEAMFEAAEAIANDAFYAPAHDQDEAEPQLVDGEVRLHPSVKPAVDAYIEAGFLSAPFDEADGGLQLPYLLNQALNIVFAAANTPLFTYPGLTAAAANLLSAHGSAEMKDQWMRPMIAGRYAGTMALSEPQAGSSLADLKTVAEPVGDGSYRLRGSKMWITAADHDLAENIVHLVLARTPGAPLGTRGVSLFLVPKTLPDGRQNDVRVVGLNHKMGFRVSVNTVFALGEEDGAVGWLVGEEHRGLPYMFHMMNEARIGVGIISAAMGYAAYLYSLDYAKERPQGRALAAPDPGASQIPIIEHADVRRMLLAQKALSEGALHLALYASRLVDQERIAKEAGDAEEAQRVASLLDVLTPIVKAWNSEYTLRANEDAIQVLGGYGYTRDYPVERIYRDNRLNPIHEGTNGIQALDLLGRKIMGRGAGPALLEAITQTLAEASNGGDEAKTRGGELAVALERTVNTIGALAEVGSGGNVEAMLANATPFLHLLGHTVVAWLWLEQVIVAERRLEENPPPEETEFLRGKLQAAAYFYRWELPKTELWAARLSEVDRSWLDAEASWF